MRWFGVSLGGPDRAPRCRRCRRAMGCEAWPSSSPISGTVSGGWGAAGPGLDGAGPAAAGGCCASGRGVRPSSDSPVTSPAPFPSPSVAPSCSRRSPHEMATRPGGRREMRGGGGAETGGFSMRERGLFACVCRRFGASFSPTASFAGGERERGSMPIVGVRPGWVGLWRAAGCIAGLPDLPAAADAQRHRRKAAGLFRAAASWAFAGCVYAWLKPPLKFRFDGRQLLGSAQWKKR